MTLKPFHKRAARMLIAGHTPSEIAKALGLAVGSIYSWTQCDEFQEYLGNLENQIDQAFVKEVSSLRKKVVKKVKYAIKRRNPEEYQWGVERAIELTNMTPKEASEELTFRRSGGNPSFALSPKAKELAKQFLQESMAPTVDITPQKVVPIRAVRH